MTMIEILSVFKEKKAAMEINYIGYLTAPTGLGMGARTYVNALRKQGFNKINCVDVTYLTLHKSHEFPTDYPYLPMKKSCINIIHVNSPELPLTIKTLGSHYFKNSYNIGIWAWETLDLPSTWHEQFKLLDEIWALSTFTTKSINRASPIPVVTIPYAISNIAAKPNRNIFNLPDNEFIFLFNFDYLSVEYRKNPSAVIEAFKKTFTQDDPVRLVIKTINSEFEPTIANMIEDITKNLRITFINERLDIDKQYTLLASCDCYISLHRAEGFGLGMAEAMSLGKPVIATGWSGNTDFMNICNSFLVKYSLKNTNITLPNYPSGTLWAEPDIKYASKLMRTVYSSPVLRKKIGTRAKKDIKSMLSEDIIGKKIKERLSFIINEISSNKPKSIQKIKALNN